MTLTALDTHITVAKHTLADLAKDGQTFGPTMIPIRNGLPVASVMPPDDTSLLKFARLVAAGFVAEEMLLVCDTWSTRSPIDPRTGEAWKHNALEEAVVMDDGLAKGWVSEALTLTWFVKADGSTGTVVLPYTRTDTDIVWAEPELDKLAVDTDAVRMWSAAPRPESELDDETIDSMLALLLTFKGCTVELMGVGA